MRNIYFADDSLFILDQSRLPEGIFYVQLDEAQQVADAIIKLQVRGAPLIGVTAAFGLALAISKYEGSKEDLADYFKEVKGLLANTRPTAVNLFWALQRMQRVFDENYKRDFTTIAKVLKTEAEIMFAEDVATNKAMGEYGQAIVSKPAQIMTICNAGHLATCGYGTALGVIRAAAERNNIKKVWACETRPVLQGSRLTVWELIQDNIPVTLITDSMAGYVMAKGDVDAIVVGADRIASNGDTANKIGTYSLAVLADYHQIPFYIAAPISTIDFDIATGAEIPIEQRNADEVRQVMGSMLTVPDVEVFNPAFDVTPHQLIKGIITEKGIVKPPFDLKELKLKDR
ncbi:MAG TPA: S-methyl-5-thioribose-1-phosphate isomerase [Syntrophomonadaceae bacterium]|nr:S-methyl-5-thioribose-1-phosphate isomerase [Syntrophomonadaceae bacterium]